MITSVILIVYRMNSLAAIELKAILEKIGTRTFIEILGFLVIMILWIKLQGKRGESGAGSKQTRAEGMTEAKYHLPRFQKQAATHAEGSIEGFELQTFLNGTHIVDLWEVVDTNATPPTRAVLSVVKSKLDSIVVKKISRAVNLLSGFSHPNIVSFLGEGKGPCTGEWEQYKRYGSQVYYVISEYIQGGTVKERLAVEDQERIPLVEAVYIAIDVLYALEFLTYLNLVHRNLKPANIMIDRRGVAKITGFHLLKEVKDPSNEGDQILTRDGVSLGTPEYMSLDQCKDAAHVDNRGDIYSIGVILYQMLTGKSPFRGKNLNETFKNIRDLTVADVCSLRSEVPSELGIIVSKSIERDVNKRYQTATEFRRALEALF